jgi:hypothetical protein
LNTLKNVNMAKGKKIIGGEISRQLQQIELGKLHPFRFIPELNTELDVKGKQELFSKVELLYINITDTNRSDFKKYAFVKGNVVDQEILFSVQIQDAKNVGIYYAVFAEVERNQKDELVSAQILSSFTFQVVNPETENTFGNNVPFSLEGVERNINKLQDVKVSLKSSDREKTNDIEFWSLIRSTTDAISFKKYNEFINEVCGIDDLGNIRGKESKGRLEGLARRRFLPFNDTDSYRTIKVLTEFFLLVNCPLDSSMLPGYAETLPPADGSINVIPYMRVLREKLKDLAIKPKDIGDVLNLFIDIPLDEKDKLNGTCYGILRDKLASPCLLELIWSYWHEEAMLVQSLNAVSLRFQNRKQPGKVKDPLGNMAIAPLLPLNNLLWGYVQDEQHRLTVLRRAYEYDHHYGITLQGKAVPSVEGADSRSNFLEAFHSLLYRATVFYKQFDDLTVKADGFPVLNGLREVHFILSEGMHNQYGDLPWVARVEMLMQQWMLSRPEFREFLPSRTMVAYPEPWMGPLSTMNSLQGWTGNSPINFNSLGVYGEDLLLSIRFGNWNDPNLNADNAANWAIFWRNEIQGYIHAYRTVTGVDLSMPHPQTGKIDAQQPALHLQRRAKMGSNGNGQVSASANGKSTVTY